MIRGRARTSQIPIIFVTGKDERFHHAHRAYELGAFDYVTKPFDDEVLRMRVGGFVRLYEQAQELRYAQEATRVRDVCIAVLSHDLRNPLSAIKMAMAAMARANDLPERHRRSVEHVTKTAHRMEHLINDVLDFTRSELGGGMVIRREPSTLAAIARQIVDEARLTHPDRAVELIIEHEADGHWDATRIGQLLSNLICNALQYSTINPVIVRIGGKRTQARLSVENVGTIAPEVRDRLFEPFRRGNDSTPGLGLGLYIVREIAKAHGGVIDLRCDDVNNTTAFIVLLPRREVGEVLSTG